MSSPTVLFVCVSNAGKSQMAAALLRRDAPHLDVHSAGTHPGDGLNPQSRACVEEVGASMDGEYCKPVDDDLLRRADRVVVLGTSARLEAPDGVDVQVWATDEPSSRGITGVERMRLIRDDIAARVADLRAELETTARG